MEQLPGVGGRPNLLQAFESSDRTKFALRDPLPDRLSPLHGHFRLEVSGESAGTILRLLGELDLASSPALEEELDKVAGHASVVVDLRELQFIDSTGLSVLVKANQRASESGSLFGLVSAGDGQVDRLLRLTGLSERLRMAGTPEELLSGG